MKRDWDLVREILVAMEGMPDTASRLNPNAINGYDSEIVSYHLSLMNDAGMINAQCSKAKPLVCFGTSLTWAGHELLDQIREQTAWNKIKSLIKEKGLGLSYEALKVALGAVIADTF